MFHGENWTKKQEVRNELTMAMHNCVHITSVYIDIPEINISSRIILGMPSSTELLGSNERDILMTEIAGQLYAYRVNDTYVVLGTRKADVFGAAVGADSIANGAYQCFASNEYNNVSASIFITIPGYLDIKHICSIFQTFSFLSFQSF